MMNRERLRRAQERMREHNIDAYLVLTHDDYLYFFGEARFQPRAIIPATGSPILVVFRGEEAEVREHLGADDVRIFGSVAHMMKDVVGVMRELVQGKSGLTVGVQMGFFTPAFLLDLFQRNNPQVKVVDIGAVMDELRIVKEPEEVERIRRAGELAAIGMGAALKTLASGVTEREVAAEAEYAMRKAGGDGTATPVYVNSGVRSGWLHGTATGKVIGAGELVVIDLVPISHGYCANLCRTVVAGSSTDQHERMLGAYEAARQAVLRAMRPGVTMRELDVAAKAVFDKAGFGEFFVMGISHGIGLAFEEIPAPTIKPAEAKVAVREGMVLTVGHSVLSIPGVGGVRLEDTYHVSPSGPTPLTTFPVGLTVAP
jgi:Xaa-Pro aminopeptidase